MPSFHFVQSRELEITWTAKESVNQTSESDFFVILLYQINHSKIWIVPLYSEAVHTRKIQGRKEVGFRGFFGKSGREEL